MNSCSILAASYLQDFKIRRLKRQCFTVLCNDSFFSFGGFQFLVKMRPKYSQHLTVYVMMRKREEKTD